MGDQADADREAFMPFGAATLQGRDPIDPGSDFFMSNLTQGTEL